MPEDDPDQVQVCLRLTILAERRPAEATDLATRCENEFIAVKWRHVARTLELLEPLYDKRMLISLG